MSRPGYRANPTFFWQGLLILLPVVILAGLGLFFVRQDKLLAEHDAVERAREIADDLLPKLRAELLDTNRFGSPPVSFQVDADGRLLSPPPAAPTPVPETLDLSALNQDQRRLWLAARAAEISSPAPSPAIGAYRDFLATTPPEVFEALARFSLGLLLAKADDFDAARSCFEAVWNDYPQAVGESGLPLKPLAGLKLLQLRPAGESGTNAHSDLLDQVCSNVVWRPTSISAEILNRVSTESINAPARETVAHWQQVWLDHERARELFAAVAGTNAAALRPAAAGSPGTHAFWFATPEPLPVRSIVGPGPRSIAFANTFLRSQPSVPSAEAVGPPAAEARGDFALDRLKRHHANASGQELATIPEADQNWLLLRAASSTTNHSFICRSQYEIGARLTAPVINSKQIPEYFGVGLDVSGRRLTWPAPDLRMWDYENYFGREGGGQKKAYSLDLSREVLATAPPATARVVDDGLLKVSIYLTSRGALLAREKTRSFWLAALVGAATLAAGVGFFKAYRAFHRQLRLSELKSNFVSSVSHELRAPIASVRLMAESLERGKVAEPLKQREYFQFIVQECRRLSSLVDNVLDFSRSEQGRKQYDFEPTDLRALAEQTVKLLEPYAAERQVRLELQFQNLQPVTCNPQLNADGKALQQALVNLIDNAIKHSPKGQTVTVGVECRPAPSALASPPSEPAPDHKLEPIVGSILLWVEDHGEGIPSAEHAKIFERFYRRGCELRRETQGVGIGLSIVKHIVEAHHGVVRVRSEVGQGSRFTIELPAQDGTQIKSQTRMDTK